MGIYILRINTISARDSYTQIRSSLRYGCERKTQGTG